LSTRIGVLGNCDTAGMAAALRSLMTGSEIVALTPPGGATERKVWAAELPNKVELVLVNNTVFKGWAGELLEPQPVQIRRYPTSIFSAFHPDCCYVGIKSTNSLIHPAYNSALCVAGFVHGVSQEQVVPLFCSEVFEQLGFYDGWAPSVKRLQGEFAESGLDFRPYYLKVKRLGAFMHSINHPKVDAVITMARFLAIELGAGSEALETPTAVGDSLAGLDWPLYPEIAEFYGLRGGYVWKMDGQIMGLNAFVARSFARYAELGLKANEVFFSHPEFNERFATVLNERGIGNE